jgi:phosphoenolpyruvate---glycerone phosphotransferase subunit DhaL
MNNFTDKDIRAVFGVMAVLMNEKKDWLIELDGMMGDGDLGLTMSTGFNKVVDALKNFEETDIGGILSQAGMVLAQAVPSTMGTLMATGLMKGGILVQGKHQIDLVDFAVMLDGFVTGIMTRGKAKPGDKTIVDSLYPAVLALKTAVQGGKALNEGLELAYEAAAKGLAETENMISQHGRAAYYQEKSLGKQDPGAAVGKLFLQAFVDYLRNK